MFRGTNRSKPFSFSTYWTSEEWVEIDASKPWRGVYGPNAIDVTLDLLFDEVSGAVDLRNSDRLSKIELARELAAVAKASNDLIIARGPLRERSAFSSAPSQSYLPPMPGISERFVRECRRSQARRSALEGDEFELVAEAAE